MLFLGINVYNLVYTCVFLLFTLIAYMVIIQTNLEKLFKQGQIVAIRVAQILLAILIGYGLASAIMSLYNATQFAS